MIGSSNVKTCLVDVCSKGSLKLRVLFSDMLTEYHHVWKVEMTSMACDFFWLDGLALLPVVIVWRAIVSASLVCAK